MSTVPIDHQSWCQRNLCDTIAHRSRATVIRSRDEFQTPVTVGLVLDRAAGAEVVVVLSTEEGAIWLSIGQARAVRHTTGRLVDATKAGDAS